MSRSRRASALGLLAVLAVPAIAMAGPADDELSQQGASAQAEGRAALEKLEEGDKIRLLQWDEGKALEAVPIYEEARTLGADPFEVEWRLASTYFWAGENTKDDDKLVEYGKKGVAHAEKAAKLEPERVEGHYYTAVCWGTYSHGVSIPTAIMQGVEKKFLNAIRKAEKIDATFEDGAPLNALGRFYYELPWPKRDVEKSEKYLKKNLEAVPCNLRTHVYYADTVLKKGDDVGGREAEDVAKEHYRHVLENEHCPSNPGDGDLAKKWAKERLAELKD